MWRQRIKRTKSYKRSNDPIKDAINHRINDDSHIDASDIDVKVTTGEVVLSGTIDSKEAKRRAEDIAEAVSGVTNVENHIRVSRTVTTVGSTNIREQDRENETETERKKSSWI